MSLKTLLVVMLCLGAIGAIVEAVKEDEIDLEGLFPEQTPRLVYLAGFQ